MRPVRSPIFRTMRQVPSGPIGPRRPMKTASDAGFPCLKMRPASAGAFGPEPSPAGPSVPSARRNAGHPPSPGSRTRRPHRRPAPADPSPATAPASRARAPLPGPARPAGAFRPAGAGPQVLTGLHQEERAGDQPVPSQLRSFPDGIKNLPAQTGRKQHLGVEENLQVCRRNHHRP